MLICCILQATQPCSSVSTTTHVELQTVLFCYITMLSSAQNKINKIRNVHLLHILMAPIIQPTHRGRVTSIIVVKILSEHIDIPIHNHRIKGGFPVLVWTAPVAHGEVTLVAFTGTTAGHYCVQGRGTLVAHGFPGCNRRVDIRLDIIALGREPSTCH